jgi:thymidylate synthase (FAD)
MKVTLIDYNQHAVEKLIFCKNTRLQMSASNMEEIENMSYEDKLEALEYIANTIKSSWEFLDFTFMIEGVSRAFTHQFVRNRMGSYAQQTMRILDVSGFDYITGPSIQTEEQMELYHGTMATIAAAYDELIEQGVKIEDARGILPTNICTNIVVKYNLRTLSDMMASRSSSRTQGEFRLVIDAMYEAVIAVMPWLHMFLRDKKTQAANRLEKVILGEFGGCHECTDYIKLIDILRNS